MSQEIFPFGQPFQASAPATQGYDLTIAKAYPGLVEQGTEPNGVQVVLREVAGVSWWVINADWNPLTQRWEQNPPCNAANPAYALAQGQDGTLTRYVALATLVPGSALTWMIVWQADQNGAISQATQTQTVANDYAYHTRITWNVGVPNQTYARFMEVTDTSSAANSCIDVVNVNGTTVWAVQKDGTLIAGHIPYSLITGVPAPNLNNLHLTGNTVIDNLKVTGPAEFDGPVTMTDGLTVTGGETVDTLHVTGKTTTGSLEVTGNEQVDGNLNVSGSTSLNSLSVSQPITGPGAPVNGGLGTVGTTSIAGGQGVGVTGASGSVSGLVSVSLPSSAASGQSFTCTAIMVIQAGYGSSSLQVGFIDSNSRPDIAQNSTITFPINPSSGTPTSPAYYHNGDQFVSATTTPIVLSVSWTASGGTSPSTGIAVKLTGGGSVFVTACTVIRVS